MHNPVSQTIARDEIVRRMELFIRRQINRAVKMGGQVAIQYNARLYPIDRARITRGRLQVREISIMTGRKRWKLFVLGEYRIQFSTGNRKAGDLVKTKYGLARITRVYSLGTIDVQLVESGKCYRLTGLPMSPKNGD